MDDYITLLEKIAEMQYPIAIKNGQETLPTLTRIFQGYTNMLDEIPDNTLIIGIKLSVTRLKDKILNIHKAYIEGSFKDAYILTDELITDFKEKINIYSIAKDEYMCLYRSRTQESHISLETNEMSHISYKNRQIVGSNRFSAPGTPCLYLASSSYLCWLEAGRPSNNTFNVCAFKPVKKLRILDLSCCAGDLLNDIRIFLHEKQALDSNENLTEEYRERLEKEIPEREKQIPLNIETFLHTWLITLACCVKVKVSNEKNRAFKEEYIIPQLLLQSLLQNKIDGIKYISTNIYISTKNSAIDKFINYAFPAKGNDNELVSHFLATQVLNAASCQGFTSLRKDVQEISKFLNKLQSGLSGRTGIAGNLPINSHLPSYHNLGIMPYSSGLGGFAYRDSVFGEIETILRNEFRYIGQY